MKPYRSVGALVKHKGLSKGGERLLLLRYDVRLCVKHAHAVAAILRKLRRNLPDVLRRARKMDMILEGWSNNSSAEVTHFVYVDEGKKPTKYARGEDSLDGTMILSLSRHNPSSFTVRVGHVFSEGGEIVLFLRLLDFMENLHLEGGDAALILRLMRDRVTWAMKQIIAYKP